MTLTYRHTRMACFISYVAQPIINNLPPLLFLTYSQQFHISLTQISLLITVNFAIQMCVDFLSAHFIDKIGYRASIVIAHAAAVLGLWCLALLPWVIDAYTGLVIATMLGAVGGGLLEVLVSPMVEALPSVHKEKEMSLLHSFYCWGHVAVVLLSTGYFLLFGTRNWMYLPLLWSLVPFFNLFLFIKAPLCTLSEEGRTMGPRQLIKKPLFWLLFLLMICSGASEMAMSQWTSFFAEEGLKVSKTTGDLLGGCSFAFLMGLSRLLFSKGKISIEKALFLSGILCVISYLTAVFSPSPLPALIGCGICGFSVGVLWPGIYSLAAKKLPSGGTAMFALLALAGDIGCCSGPTVVGAVSDGVLGGAADALRRSVPMWFDIPASSVALKVGFLAALTFPLILVIGTAAFLKARKK